MNDKKTSKDKEPRIKNNIDLPYIEKGLVVAGMDEAGRGPLYGPVVAAAVVLSKGFDTSELDDSKKLSAKKREELSHRIKSDCCYGIGLASAREIEEINILEATKLAMRRAVAELVESLAASGILAEGSDGSKGDGADAKGRKAPDVLLIDAVKLDDIKSSGIGEVVSVIKGDTKSASIAAASIVAKVARDHMIMEDAKKYPGYGLESHKGYGTKKHYEAIDKLGVLPEHRMSFLRKYFERRGEK